MLCSGMEFNHLPDPGGIYQQRPELMEGFMYILVEQNKYEKQKQKQEEMKRKSAKPKGNR